MCLDRGSFCQNGQCFQCPDGTRCSGPGENDTTPVPSPSPPPFNPLNPFPQPVVPLPVVPTGLRSPCKAVSQEPSVPCPGAYGDFQCIEAQSYCVDGSIISCPNDGYCHGNAGEAPCKSEKPEGPTCTAPNNACVEPLTYCSQGIVFECPEGLVCKASFPCVEPADDTCTAANNTCLTAEGSDLYCLGGEKLSCPEGYECGEPIAPGLAPCRPRPQTPTEVCWSGADDYTCLDSESYCLVSCWAVMVPDSRCTRPGVHTCAPLTC